MFCFVSLQNVLINKYFSIGISYSLHELNRWIFWGGLLRSQAQLGNKSRKMGWKFRIILKEQHHVPLQANLSYLETNVHALHCPTTQLSFFLLKNPLVWDLAKLSVETHKLCLTNMHCCFFSLRIFVCIWENDGLLINFEGCTFREIFCPKPGCLLLSSSLT